MNLNPILLVIAAIFFFLSIVPAVFSLFLLFMARRPLRKDSSYRRIFNGFWRICISIGMLTFLLALMC